MKTTKLSECGLMKKEVHARLEIKLAELVEIDKQIRFLREKRKPIGEQISLLKNCIKYDRPLPEFCHQKKILNLYRKIGIFKLFFDGKNYNEIADEFYLTGAFIRYEIRRNFIKYVNKENRFSPFSWSPKKLRTKRYLFEQIEENILKEIKRLQKKEVF